MSTKRNNFFVKKFSFIMRMYEDINNELHTGYRSNANIDWHSICTHYVLTESFIEKYKRFIRWDCISCQKLSENFIEKYKDKFNWHLLTVYQTFSNDFMEKHSDLISWDAASKYQKLSEELIERYKNKVDWFDICTYQKLSESFMEKNKANIYWEAVSRYQILSEDFISSNKDLLDWYYISCYQKLSDEFIEKYKDYVAWGLISKFQHLSENFIDRNFSYLTASIISKYQRLSDEFVERHEKYLDIDCLLKYQKLSKNYLEKYNSNESFNLFKENWVYKSTNWKKQAVINTGNYECYDDYFIAYKAIREDRYSLYNFQYKYEKGGIYESWCDCSGDEDSFGLNVGTETFAKRYGFSYSDSKIVRCKVRYEDVGRIVHNGDKIRCFKIEILD